MSEEGVLGHTLGKPGEAIRLACESLRDAVERPIVGRPHAPNRIRVASPELAEALRAGQPGFEIVCAPTPEIDVVLAAMVERMDEDAQRAESYLSPDVGPATIAALFQAAAVLFRAKPWAIVPNDQCLFAVDVEALGIRDAALSVMGQMGQSLGFILFANLDDFEAYLDAAEAMEHGEEAAIPPHLVLNFERGAELSASLRKEIAEHRWEVAGSKAYPWLGAVDEDLVARPPTAAEVSIATAVSVALVEILKEKSALLGAWNGGEPVACTLVVATPAGEVEVSLRAPYERERSDYGPSYDVMADLFELGRDGDEIDPEERGPLQDELVSRFAASPEGRALDDVQFCHFVMDFAADYFNATIATLGARDLREILFDIIPRKVSIDASAARSIVEVIRAFFAFLKREYRLDHADACLRVLGDDAVKKLEAALSDTNKFGLAKSLVMRGREAGFDMDSKAGIEAWMRVMQSQPLPASVRLPGVDTPARPPVKAAARAKKNARKAARKARRKNR